MFEKGISGNPSGRPPGAKNKVRFEVGEILRDHNCNPFEILAKIAMGTLEGVDERRITVEWRMKAAAELAQYCAPRLKAVEVSNDPTNPILVNLNFRNAN